MISLYEYIYCFFVFLMLFFFISLLKNGIMMLVMIGMSNKAQNIGDGKTLLTSKASKEYYTLIENAKKIYEYLNIDKNKIIMCPWSQNWGAFVVVGKQLGYKVINLTNDNELVNYKNVDYVIVDNPPFRKQNLLNVLNTNKPYFIYWSYMSIYAQLKQGVINLNQIVVPQGIKLNMFALDKKYIYDSPNWWNKTKMSGVPCVFINNLGKTGILK